MTWEQIVTILAVIGSALTVYFNLKKFGDSIRQEIEWRTTVNINMTSLLERVDELLQEHKNSSTLIRELMESNVKMNFELAAVKTEIKTLWKRVDENRHYIDHLKGMKGDKTENYDTIT